MTPVKDPDDTQELPLSPQRTMKATPAVGIPAQDEEPYMQFFEYKHLPEKLQPISREFALMAHWIVANLPRNPQRTAALTNLLTAKDCAVRAAIWK